MCRYLPASAVNRPVGLGVYTKAMMINRILTICAAIAAGMAGTSLAHAQQGYPAAPGQVYSTAPGPYVPGGYATDERRGPGEPDFDALDDDDAPNGQNAAALPPPGPVLSPSDPRYGRPAASDEYVRIDHLGVVRGFIFRDDLFRALPDVGLFARRVAGLIDRAVVSAPNADRDAVEHRSAGARVTR